MKIRVYYEDTDIGGIVYHTNYIKYCERARSEMVFKKGKLPTDGEKTGFVVKNIDADFLGMATLGDMLEVKSEVIKQKVASVIIRQSIFKEEKKVFEMKVTLVFVRDGRPKMIPEHLHDLFV